jgi:hypothetical protein
MRLPHLDADTDSHRHRDADSRSTAVHWGL